MLISPIKPTLKRYWNLFVINSNISLLRAMQYESFFSLNLKGKILDFGGGKKAGYINLLEKKIDLKNYFSVNINNDMQPSFLISEMSKIPIPDDSYEIVFSLNTLEHVYNIDYSLSELYRVLKPGGELIISTPFLFRVHGCPNDYQRPTADWWDRKTRELNLKDVIIKPLIWDPQTAKFSISERGGVLGKTIKLSLGFFGLFYSFLKSGFQANHNNETSCYLSSIANGYIITARK